MNAVELLGIDLPIIQAPMAGVQDSALAIAVARAGGLGSLPCAMLSAEQLVLELQTIAAKNTSPINLNFFCHQTPNSNPKVEQRWLELLAPYFTELGIDINAIEKGSSRQPFSHRVADIIEPFKPQILSFHFGLPEQRLLKRVKAWGSTIISSATTLNEALWLEKNGADLVIAQGLEAGGHRSMFLSRDLHTQLPTDMLLKSMSHKISLPIIAAGGITHASDVESILKSGAIAAQIGTAYLLCDEAKTSNIHRDSIRQHASLTTQLTNLFSGRPARGIRNRLMQELGDMNSNVPEFPLAAPAITALRSAAEALGSNDFSPLWCGQNTSGCEQISAFELTRKLASQAP